MGAPQGFAPQVMGAPQGFAPQVMGPPQGFAPQVMGAPPAPPVVAQAPTAMPAPVPLAATHTPLPVGSDPDAPPPPAMGTPMGVTPEQLAASGALQSSGADDLAASPWNRANQPSFNRDLLPSAMASPASEPAPPSKRPTQTPAQATNEPSRAPWIIVGVLVLVAIAGGVLAFQIHARRSDDGQIAVPGGGVPSATEDTPADSAPAVSATTAPRSAPVVRPYKPKPASDDPYDDVPVSRPKKSAAPSPAPATAPHRVFGTEN
jgi:hypothetical protein